MFDVLFGARFIAIKMFIWNLLHALFRFIVFIRFWFRFPMPLPSKFF